MPAPGLPVVLRFGLADLDLLLLAPGLPEVLRFGLADLDSVLFDFALPVLLRLGLPELDSVLYLFLRFDGCGLLCGVISGWSEME